MIRRPPASAALLLAGAAILYAIDLGHAPIYLHEAEVLFALHAHSIATTLRDTNGRLLPLYFEMPQIGENVWFHPAIVYAMAPFLAVLPLSEAAIRLPSVIVGLLDLVLVYFIARRLFDSDRWALGAAALLALTPSHFIHSRMAMDYLYPVPFVLAWLLCLQTFIDRRDLRMLFAATSFLGFGLYTYIASVLMMPLYLAMTLAVVRAVSEARGRAALAACAGFAWPLCLLAWLAFHPQVLNQTVTRYGIVDTSGGARSVATSAAAIVQHVLETARPSAIAARVSQYWSFFDPAYLFLTGGYANVVNSTRHVGVFTLPFLILVPVGAVALASGRPSPLSTLTLVGFATAPIAACLVVPEPYAIDRELALLPFGALVAAAGARALMATTSRTRRAMGIALLAAVPVHFALFLVDYYRDYPPRSAFWFSWNRRGAIEAVLAADRARPAPAVYLSTHHITSIDAYWRLYLIKYHREDLLPKTVYFDSDRFDVESIPTGSLVLVGPDDRALGPSIAAGALRVMATIPEPADSPFFSLLARTDRRTIPEPETSRRTR